MAIGKCQQALDDAARATKDKSHGQNDWGRRHHDAWFAPRKGFEAAFVVSLKGLATYADAVLDAYEDSPLGKDYVMGDYWLDSLRSLLKLRTGEMGRFDAGALGDAAIEMCKAAGFPEDELEDVA